MSDVEIRGATLFYTERGTGEPVIFIHGGLSDHRTWTPQLEAVGDRFRVIAYSRRWHWPNQPVPATAVSLMDEHVQDLAALIEALDVAPAHLVGNSWGAGIALTLACRRPELVRSLVLEEPPAIPVLLGQPVRPGRVISQLLRRPRTTLPVIRFGATVIGRVEKLFAAGLGDRAMRTFLDGVLGRVAYERLPEARKQQMRDNLGELAAEFRAHGGFSALSEGMVRRITVPTLLISGERSPLFLRRMSAFLVDLIPGARLTMIPTASHVMHEENAAATNAAILGFLGGAAGRLPARAVA